jgi:hypothetical protein
VVAVAAGVGGDDEVDAGEAAQDPGVVAAHRAEADQRGA